MSIYNTDLVCRIGEHDTFAVPFLMKRHIPLESEEYIFTIRRVLEGHRPMGKPPVFGDVLFQKVIKYADLELIKDENDAVIGCRFYVMASSEESSNIPKGINSYDLAIRDTVSGMELELVPPSKFIVGEVLRYE